MRVEPLRTLCPAPRMGFAISAVVALVGCASGPVNLNDPFILSAGETRQIGPDGFEVTLRSIDGDSGCFSASDCSTMIFHGSLAVRRGAKSELMLIQAVIRPGQPLSLSLDGYAFDVTEVRRGRDGRFQITLVVHGDRTNARAR